MGIAPLDPKEAQFPFFSSALLLPAPMASGRPGRSTQSRLGRCRPRATAGLAATVVDVGAATLVDKTANGFVFHADTPQEL